MAGMSKTNVSPQALGDAQADKRLEILQLVREHGSISQAARVAEVSYKAAWQALHTLSNLAGEPLVNRSVGGAGGGGARITPAGERLLQAADLLGQARRQVLARLDQAQALAVVDAPRTSMRNTLPAQVLGLDSAGRGDPLVRVHLGLPGDGKLSALITRESAELLNLETGAPVLALSKATAVRIVPGAVPAPDQAAETGVALTGRVSRVSRGSASDEVTLALAGGQQLVGFAQRPNRLRSGARAHAWVDERVLVLARV